MRRNSRKLIAIDHADDGLQVWHWGEDPMPRFVCQRDGYRCGPIAVANALKWAGVNFSWKKNMKKLVRDMQCCKGHGTFPQDLENALKKWGKGIFTVRYRTEKMKLKTIREEISRGRAIVVDFSWPKKRPKKSEETDGHYALLFDIRVDEDGTEYYGMVNLGYIKEGLAVEYITGKVFKKLCLRRAKGDNFWILRKISK